MAPPDTIRILDLCPGREDARIECEIREVALNDKAVQYEALSYVWGDSAGRKTIKVAGCEVVNGNAQPTISALSTSG